MSQYLNTAWQGKKPESYQLDEVDRSTLQQTPKHITNLGKILAGVVVFSVMILIVFSFSFLMVLGDGYDFSSILLPPSEWHSDSVIVAIFFTSLFLSILGYTGFSIFDKKTAYLTPDYPHFISEIIKEKHYVRLDHAAPSPITPVFTMSHRNLKPTIWKERGFADKYGRDFFSWNEETLTSYQFRTSFIRNLFKFLRRANFCYLFLFSWVHVVRIFIYHEFWSIHSLVLLIQILLFYSGKFAYQGWLSRTKTLEFNRLSGMVEKFDKHGNQVWQYPFIEFNAYIHTVKGTADYMGRRSPTQHYLKLVHRHSPHWTEEDAAIFDQSWYLSTYDGCHELWAVLVNYMDVKKPLPISIALEECRDKDHTSRIYQKAVKYFPQFLTISDEEYKQAMESFKEQKLWIKE